MVIVIEYNSGIDGWDGKSKEVATFDTAEMAWEALKERGYYVDWNGKPVNYQRNPSVYHADTRLRWQMGNLSYSLKGVAPALPHNQLP